MNSGRRRAQHLHIRQPELEFLAKPRQLPPLATQLSYDLTQNCSFKEMVDGTSLLRECYCSGLANDK